MALASCTVLLIAAITLNLGQGERGLSLGPRSHQDLEGWKGKVAAVAAVHPRFDPTTVDATAEKTDACFSPGPRIQMTDHSQALGRPAHHPKLTSSSELPYDIVHTTKEEAIFFKITVRQSAGPVPGLLLFAASHRITPHLVAMPHRRVLSYHASGQ